MASYIGQSVVVVDHPFQSITTPPPVAETEKAYVIRMTPSVYARLVQFFKRDDNIGLRQSAMMEKLLDISDYVVIQYNNNNNTNQSAVEQQYGGGISSAANVFAATAAFGRRPEEEPNVVMDEEEEGNEYEEYESGEDEDPDEMVHDSDQPHHHHQPAADPSDPDWSPAGASGAANVRNKAGVKSTRRLVVSGARNRKPYHWKRSAKRLGTGTQKPWTSPILRRVYEMIKNWQRDGLLHCRECDRWLSVVHDTTGFRCVNALDHIIRVHVGKPAYSCRLCSHKTLTKSNIRRHLRAVHDRVNDFDDLTGTMHDLLMQRVAQCYDYGAVGGEPPPVDQSRMMQAGRRRQIETADGAGTNLRALSSVRQFVRDLMVKWKRQDALYCRLCRSWIRVDKQSVYNQTQAGFSHVCSHYGQPLYTCLLCRQDDDDDNSSEETTSVIQYQQIVRHLHLSHQQVASMGVNYREEFENHAPALKDMAVQCFDWTDVGSGQPPPLTPASPFLAKNRMNWRRNHNDQDRLDIFHYSYQLIDRYSRNSRRMRCRQCDVLSTVITVQGEQVPEALMYHALAHIRRGAYACHHCKTTTRRRDGIVAHLANVHAEQPGVKRTDFDDRTGEMKEEIMEIMKWCFDPKGK